MSSHSHITKLLHYHIMTSSHSHIIMSSHYVTHPPAHPPPDAYLSSPSWMDCCHCRPSAATPLTRRCTTKHCTTNNKRCGCNWPRRRWCDTGDHPPFPTLPNPTLPPPKSTPPPTHPPFTTASHPLPNPSLSLMMNVMNVLMYNKCTNALCLYFLR